uniref:4-coumarate--CoA ligase n=1 Tax=Ananas comosus var. bracteatus TaxID=296719 RepID=A0A6V7NQR6_ANACO|nr:unnamed protein product [Ananas comosus var. bracteatus]
MFGFSVFVCGAIAAGATTVMVGAEGRRFAAEEVMRAVAAHRVTRLPAVPPMVVQMARAARKAQHFDLSPLRECYGLTETSGPVTLCDGVKGRLHLSIGRLIPTVEAKIVDVRTGKPLPPNKDGELWIRGPPVMQGYLNNQEATALAIDEEGWLRTGDLCYVDTDGLIYVVDRIKELIKYKAYQVAPAELEEILSSHPDILDVAVTSHPDEEAGEIPMACVVRRGESKIQEEDIISFLENKVAPYKKIRKVVFLEYIPRSPSGKILRRLLKATASNQQKLEVSARL